MEKSNKEKKKFNYFLFVVEKAIAVKSMFSPLRSGWKEQEKKGN